MKTIEYSKYSSDLSRFTKDGLSLSNNESIDPQYVDYFINNDEKRNSIVREGYKNASKFTIDKICSLYKQAFNNS